MTIGIYIIFTILYIMVNPKKERKSKLEIGENLVKFLKDQNRPFHKSKLTEKEFNLGMSQQTAEEWLELYILFNNGPKVRKIKMDKRRIYEVQKD